MKTTQILVGSILILVVIFAGLNWPAFTESNPLHFLFGDVQAPLGVVMLAVVALLSAIYSIALARIQTGAWLESRRSLKELDQARRIAANKEDSRIRDLEAIVQSGFERVDEQLERMLSQFETEDMREAIRKEGDEIGTRIGQAEKEMQRELRQMRKAGAA